MEIWFKLIFFSASINQATPKPLRNTKVLLQSSNMRSISITNHHPQTYFVFLLLHHFHFYEHELNLLFIMNIHTKLYILLVNKFGNLLAMSFMSFEAEISSKPDCLLSISANYSFLSSSEYSDVEWSLDGIDYRVVEGVEFSSELMLTFFVIFYKHRLD